MKGLRRFTLFFDIFYLVKMEPNEREKKLQFSTSLLYLQNKDIRTNRATHNWH